MAELFTIEGQQTIQVKDPAEAMRMLANAEMKPFTKEDWYAYAGCESKDPMIGYYDAFVIVLDGDLLNVCHGYDHFGGTLFKLYQQ